MATAIQVTGSILLYVCVFFLFWPRNEISALELVIPIPSNAPEGFYITKLDCTDKYIELGPPGNEIQLFSVTTTGDLVLNQTVEDYEDQTVTVTMTNSHSLAECSDRDIPEISRLIIEIKNPSDFLKSPTKRNEIEGFLDMAGSTKVLGTDVDNFFGFLAHGMYLEIFDLAGSVGVNMFEIKNGSKGIMEIHLSDNNVPSCVYCYMVLTVRHQDGRVLFTNVLVTVVNNPMSNMENIRKPPSIRVVPEDKLDFWTQQTHDLLVSSYQQKFSIKQHRSRRQAITQIAAVQANVNEGTTGTLYTFTRAWSSGTGTTFELVQATPDGVVKVTSDGRVILETGKILDYDNSFKAIEVQAYETGTTGKFEHQLKVVILDVNDEIPKFTNVPSPFLATVNAWARVGTSVYLLTCLDPDTGSGLGFYLDGTSDQFQVDEQSGEIRTKSLLTQNSDADITVYCQDKNASSQQISVKRTVSITTRYRGPQFYLDDYQASIPETAQIGQSFSLQNSEGQEIQLETVNFQNGETMYLVINPMTTTLSELFEIKEGKLVTKQVFDHEKKAQYTLTLQAKDSVSEMVSEVQLTANILDVNEYTPEFVMSAYYVAVPEDLSLGQSVIQVTADDRDTSSAITYTVDNDLFDVVNLNNVGEIRVNGTLNYETAPNQMYVFIVTAVDDGGVTNTKRTSSATVIVQLINVNDITPKFLQTHYTQTVRDDVYDSGAPPDQKFVMQLQAYDEDGDGITYSLGNGSPSFLEINANTAEIKMKDGGNLPDNIDFYDFDVLAKDDNGCCVDKTPSLHTGTASVTIYIVDAVNLKPRFMCNYEPVVVEEQNASTSVVTVNATDTGRGDMVVYSLRPDRGFDANKTFVINKTTGEITTLKKLNREDPNFDTMFITVQATDRGNPPLSDLCTFVVKLQDINDHAPIFTSTSYTQSVYKNTVINTYVFAVLAEDLDAGLNAQITYQLTDNPGNYFSIPDSSSGMIRMIKSLDLNTSPTKINLTVQACDGGTPSKCNSAMVTINIQSEYPPPSPVDQRFELTFVVSEVKDIGTEIGNILVDSMLNNTSVSLQIVNNGQGLFSTRAVSSALDNNKYVLLIAKRRFIYEKEQQFRLLIRTSNEYNIPQNTYLLVTVNVLDANMQTPFFIGQPLVSADNYNIKLTVLEGRPQGELVGTVVAIDGDYLTPAYSNLTYQALATSEYFRIDSMSGNIETKFIFDAEQTQIYYFSIIVKDGAPSDVPNHKPENTSNSATATVQVQISDDNDNAPEFLPTSYHMSIRENAHLLDSVGSVHATDKDSGHVFTFSLEPTVSGERNPFAIHWKDGYVYVSGYLDYETKSSYDLQVRVFDGKFAAYATITINVTDVNDMVPKFSQSVYEYTHITEADYATVGHLQVGQLSATDGDTGRSTQTTIRYAILTDDPVITQVFKLEEVSGNLIVKGNLDRDNGREVYKFTVSAVDEPGSSLVLTGHATVIVRPIDSNDNRPVFVSGTLEGSVLEDATVGTTVMTVMATDKDEGANGEISYSLVPITNPKFRIPSSGSGLIETNAQLDREENATFSFSVLARDGASGTASLSQTATVTVYVIDVNDNSPVCQNTLMNVTIPETHTGDIIAVHASDPDVSDILSYSVSDTVFSHFAVEKRGSVAYLLVHDSIDFDADAGEPFFDVPVTVTDGKFSVVCNVYVTVVDVNDNAPTFSNIHFLEDGFFSEDTPVGTIIANFTANDIDSGINKQFDFFILLESDPRKNFKVEPLESTTQGQVTIQTALDRETPAVFNLTILAMDRGTPPQTGSTVLEITLGDVNDNGPVLRADSREVFILENLEAQTNFKTLYAEDPDSAENGPPFQFTPPACDSNSPTVCGKFDFNIKAVDASLGGQALTISSLMSLDREEVSQYLVSIVIADKYGVSATSTLTINIGDGNDNSNTDATQTMFAYNYADLFKNVIIGRVGFNDLDGDEDRATKTFTQIPNTYTDAYFDVKTNGDFELKSHVPYDTAITVRVIVVDNGIQSSRGVMTATSTTTIIFTQEALAKEAPYRAGSIRLSGMTAKEFIQTPVNGISKYDKFREKMAEVLDKPVKNVQITTLIDTPDGLLDLSFAAHGSPYYSSSRMNGIITANKAAFNVVTGGKIEMIDITDCLKESCEGGCWDRLVVEGTPNVVNAGTDTRVGVTSGVVATCGCRVPVNQRQCTPDYCSNSGTCAQDDYGLLSCNCTVAFDGPRCQNTKKGFAGTGYALFKPLEQCLKWETSIEFITNNANGVILFNDNDLTKTPDVTDPTDYIVLQLRNGYPELTIDLGTGSLTLYINGTGAKQLNDGLWHHINIYKDGKLITLTVDYCKFATPGSRDSCEASGHTKSTHEYLNVGGPLQLGGISTTTNVPVGVIATKFAGCMRNLRHKGELYDLYTGGVYTGVTDTCPEEDEACANKCGDHGDCRLTSIAVMPKTSECICDSGYRSSNCDTATTEVDLRVNSFMEWTLTSALTDQLSARTTDLQLMYRTRDQDGVIFHLSSSDATEFIRLQIVNNELVLAYNLGDPASLELHMPGVVSSDGQWHTVIIMRAGKTFVMTVDGGEGPRYVTTQGSADGQEEITLHDRQIYAGAQVTYGDGNAITGSFGSMDLNSSCYNDPRLMETAWFPMTFTESSSNNNIRLVSSTAVNEGCVRSTDCVGANCPDTYVCKPLWEDHACVCPAGKEEFAGTCVFISYCRDNPCLGSATCETIDGTFKCICPPNWTGIRCNEPSVTIVEPEVEVSAALIGGIVAAVLLALIIAFIVGFLVWKHFRDMDDSDNLVDDKKDEEDYDIRENVVAYDEEGAGEEDHEGYDLNRLRKPLDMTRSDKPLMTMEKERMDKVGGAPHGPGIGEFIGDRLDDAEDDLSAPPFDTVMELHYEGGGSSAGSLSSLNTSSSGGDHDYVYLHNWGPKFSKLADLYNQYEDSD